MEMSMKMTPVTSLFRIKKSKYPFTEPNGGFDLRIVRYEDIHSINENDFNELVRLIDIKEGDRILDAGCGYGSVSREILKRCNSHNLDLILYDLHEVQLQRGFLELTGFLSDELQNNQVTFVNGDLRQIDLEDTSLDKVVAKMVIHEIPVIEQQVIFNEFYRILKPNGKLIIWDTSLNNNTQDFFKKVIKKKDELAGYKHLCAARNFLRDDEMFKLAAHSNFQEYQKAHIIKYKVISEKRLAAEFQGDKRKLLEWNAFIRKEAKTLSSEVLNELKFKDNGTSIEFNVEKAIFVCCK